MIDRIKKLRFFRALAAVAAVAVMMALSAVTGNDEIIFPETAALLIGFLVGESCRWNASPVMVASVMSVSACVGVALVRAGLSFGLPLHAQLIIGYAFVLLMLNVLGSNMTPALSACLLPIIRHSSSLMYPLVVFCIVTVVVVTLFFMPRRDEMIFVREIISVPRQCVRCALQLSFFSAAVLVSVKMNRVLLIAPPVIVAFTALSWSNSFTPIQAVRGSLLMIFAAGFGSACRLLAVSALVWCGAAYGVSFVIASVFAFAVLLFMMETGHSYFAPAGAALLLAFLLPVQSLPLYPAHVAAGMIVLAVVARFLVYCSYGCIGRRK